MKHRKQLAATFVACIASVGGGDIIAISGQVEALPPPPVIAHNTWESSTHARAFVEATVPEITEPIVMEATEPGTYNDTGDLAPASYTFDRPIQSHMIYFDPIANESVRVTGSVTFEYPVIGFIIYYDSQLATHGLLGAPGVSYEGVSRMEMYEHWFILQSDRLTVQFSMLANNGQDAIRVLTEVPTPPTMGLLAVAALCGRRRRHRGTN